MTALNPELEMVRQFLAHCLPFSDLEPSQLDRAAGAIDVYYLKKGEVVRPDDGPKHLRILRSGAVDILAGDDSLLDRLGEQESFNINGLAEDEPGVKAIAIDDSLIYRVSGEEILELRSAVRAFDRYFHDQRARRLRRAARYSETPSEFLTPLRDVVGKRLVSITENASVQDAARLMTEQRVSSLLVLSGDRLAGILTDRDIRSRVVAENLPGTTEIREVMSPDPVAVDIEGTLFDAMMLMSERGIHHLPVLDNNRPMSVLTTSDLVRTRQRDPLYLLQAISRASSVEELTEIAAEQPALVMRLVDEGAKARQVSHILCAISDQITRQLLRLAEHKLGPAPAAFTWLAFGSQGRREIALGGDQDNALVIEDNLKPEDEAYFSDLAEFTCDGLNACGYPWCPGDIMAKNATWRMRLGDWKNTVSGWVRSPTDDAVMRVSIFFDIRAVVGDGRLAQALQQHMLATASVNSIFLAALARNALCNRPPLGFFRRFVVERNGEHQDMLDLKHRGVIPVVDMARVHAIANRVVDVNTHGRLAALAEGKKLGLKDMRNLQDALDFVMQIRVQHQCEQIRAGQAPDNFVNPQQLPALARNQLRDAFSIIHDGQVTVSSHFSAGTF
jgi:CBS domain-containing protein